jgi:phospholipid transport system substrate-binding protein
MKIRTRHLTVLLTLALSWAHGSVVFAGAPLESIKSTVERVTQVLQEPGANTKKAETTEAIRGILLPRFDFEEMARRSLGNHWRELDGKQNEFVSVFTNFMENSYLSALESYQGEKVVYLRERVEQDFAQVDTQIVPAKGEPISVNYKLRLVAGEWKVYDVVVENISLVNNFRSQFNRVLASTSLDELLKRLRDKGSKKAA